MSTISATCWICDNNNAKTLGGQLSWDVGVDIAPKITLNWIAGPEEDDNAHDLRWAIQLDVSWKPMSVLEVGGSVHFGQEEFEKVEYSFVQELDATSIGLMAYARVPLLQFDTNTFETIGAALRASYWNDRDGVRTGTKQELIEVSGTLAFRPIENAVLSVEYRRDMSTKAVFAGGRGLSSRKSQDTISVNVGVEF